MPEKDNIMEHEAEMLDALALVVTMQWRSYAQAKDAANGCFKRNCDCRLPSIFKSKKSLKRKNNINPSILKVRKV